MANNLKSVEYESEPAKPLEARSRLRVGVFTAASALVGGLALAWYSRKTLAKLQQAESLTPPESPLNDEG